MPTPAQTQVTIESILRSEKSPDLLGRLGLKLGATAEDVEAAAHRLRIQFHPDRDPATAAERTRACQLISEAETTLTDERAYLVHCARYNLHLALFPIPVRTTLKPVSLRDESIGRDLSTSVISDDPYLHYDTERFLAALPRVLESNFVHLAVLRATVGLEADTSKEGVARLRRVVAQPRIQAALDPLIRKILTSESPGTKISVIHEEFALPLAKYSDLFAAAYCRALGEANEVDQNLTTLASTIADVAPEIFDKPKVRSALSDFRSDQTRRRGGVRKFESLRQIMEASAEKGPRSQTFIDQARDEPETAISGLAGIKEKELFLTNSQNSEALARLMRWCVSRNEGKNFERLFRECEFTLEQLYPIVQATYLGLLGTRAEDWRSSQRLADWMSKLFPGKLAALPLTPQFEVALRSLFGTAIIDQIETKFDSAPFKFARAIGQEDLFGQEAEGVAQNIYGGIEQAGPLGFASAKFFLDTEGLLARPRIRMLLGVAVLGSSGKDCAEEALRAAISKSEGRRKERPKPGKAVSDNKELDEGNDELPSDADIAESQEILERELEEEASDDRDDV